MQSVYITKLNDIDENACTLKKIMNQTYLKCHRLYILDHLFQFLIVKSSASQLKLCLSFDSLT